MGRVIKVCTQPVSEKNTEDTNGLMGLSLWAGRAGGWASNWAAGHANGRADGQVCGWADGRTSG